MARRPAQRVPDNHARSRWTTVDACVVVYICASKWPRLAKAEHNRRPIPPYVKERRPRETSPAAGPSLPSSSEGACVVCGKTVSVRCSHTRPEPFACSSLDSCLDSCVRHIQARHRAARPGPCPLHDITTLRDTVGAFSVRVLYLPRAK